jgi:hypothetical protein
MICGQGEFRGDLLGAKGEALLVVLHTARQIDVLRKTAANRAARFDVGVYCTLFACFALCPGLDFVSHSAGI